MQADLLILRPQPGADASAARAAALGLIPLVAPIFAARAVAWEAPDAAAFDAVLLTSAHAARLGGPQLAAFTHLPCYAIGAATADAARSAGFATVIAGTSDGQAAAARAAADGHRSVFHPCGREHKSVAAPGLTVERRIVYASEKLPLSAAAAAAAEAGAIVLLHSPRAAEHFNELAEAEGMARSRIAIAAISKDALAAAGTGWREAVAATRPDDGDLLALAAGLCKWRHGHYGHGQ